MNSSKCLLWILKNYIRNNILKWNDSCNANPPETCYFKCQIHNSHLLFSVYVQGLALSWVCFRQIIIKEPGMKPTRACCFGFLLFSWHRRLLLYWASQGLVSSINSISYWQLLSFTESSNSTFLPEWRLSLWQLIQGQPCIALMGLSFMPWHFSFIWVRPAGYANDRRTENHNPSAVMASMSMSLFLEPVILSGARERLSQGMQNALKTFFWSTSELDS